MPWNPADAYRVGPTRQCPGSGFFLGLRPRCALRCRRHGPNAEEERAVSKSILAIGSLGAAACLILSLSMQHLLEVKQELGRSPIELELEALFEGRRVGPVKVVEQQVPPDRIRCVVRLTVLAGLQKQRIALMAGSIAWSRVQGSKAEPDELVVEVHDDENGPVAMVTVPRPMRPSRPSRPAVPPGR